MRRAAYELGGGGARRRKEKEEDERGSGCSLGEEKGRKNNKKALSLAVSFFQRKKYAVLGALLFLQHEGSFEALESGFLGGSRKEAILSKKQINFGDLRIYSEEHEGEKWRRRVRKEKEREKKDILFPLPPPFLCLPFPTGQKTFFTYMGELSIFYFSEFMSGRAGSPPRIPVSCTRGHSCANGGRRRKKKMKKIFTSHKMTAKREEEGGARGRRVMT